MAIGPQSIRIIASGINTLEDLMICQALADHNMNYHEISGLLSGRSDTDLDDGMRRILRDGNAYMLPTVPLERIVNKPYMNHVTVLSYDNVPDGMSALAQIYAMIGHQPTWYENLVCSFTIGYVPALRLAGASEEEIRQILLRDRLIRGGTLGDEKAAANLARFLDRVDGATDGGQVFEVISSSTNSQLWTETVQRSLVDCATMRATPGVAMAILFKLIDGNNNVVTMKAYTDRKITVRAVEKAAQLYGYRVGTHLDERTGLEVVKVTGRATLAANAFNGCFCDPEHIIYDS